jgi:glutamate racemase
LREVKNNPIGIFDSGLGGLTVFEDVQALLPHENLIYIADSAFAPYGEKDEETIVERCFVVADILVKKHQIKALVVACNTATAAAIHLLREHLDIPVIGMEPAIKPAVDTTESGVVGVLATENTLKSDKFSSLLDKHQHRARILTQPCVGLVQAIEQGELHSERTQALLKKYVRPLLDAGADTIVLGCTHYPLLEKSIRKLVGKNVHIMSTGAAVAKQLKRQIERSHRSKQGETDFYTTGDAVQVSALASKTLSKTIVMQSCQAGASS